MTSLEKFGDYDVLAPLGQGGMATVHRALWRSKGYEVALKRMHGEPEPQAVKRFQREMRIAAALSHPHIVRLLDHGSVDGVPYCAMELVEGVTLHKQIHDRKAAGKALVTPEEFFELAESLCSALAYLHTEKVIHRDLKPSNMFVAMDGKVLLADFGLSSIHGATRVTSTGSVMGTPLYMAPEQFSGVTGNETSDVYQLGMVFYEILTGKLPFEEMREHSAILYSRTTRPTPPPSSINPLVPPAADRLVLRSIAVDPKDRYPDGKAFLEAVRSSRGGQVDKRVLKAPRARPTAAMPIVAPASPRLTAVVAGGSALALAGAFVVLYAAHAKMRAPAPAAEVPPPSSSGVLDFAIEPRAREALVSFRTGEPARSELLVTGPAGEERLSIAAAPATRHSTWLANLEPDTVYSYRVILERDGKKTATAPRELRTGK